MASLLSSTKLVEHAANDDIETSPHNGAELARTRLADRIAAIKPARTKLAREAEVEINLPAVVPIASTALVPYRVTEALTLDALMRNPEPAVAAAPSDRPGGNSNHSNPASTATPGEATPRVSEVPSLSAGTRLAELILEQRALIEDLTRLSQRVAAVTSAGNGKALTGPPTSAAGEIHEPLDVVSAAIATYPTAEPADAPAPSPTPTPTPTASRSAEDLISALAAVVENRREAEQQRTVTDADNKPHGATAPHATEAYPSETSTTSEPGWHRAPGSASTSLVLTPEPLTIASLINEERPPMIIERAYTSLPEHELGQELPRAPGFLAGLALSGAAGVALFFALRIA